MASTAPDLAERLDRILPQTQCGQCGFDGCRPYAEAMARGEAGIDHCPPGGDAGALQYMPNGQCGANSIPVLTLERPAEMAHEGSAVERGVGKSTTDDQLGVTIERVDHAVRAGVGRYCYHAIGDAIDVLLT